MGVSFVSLGWCVREHMATCMVCVCVCVCECVCVCVRACVRSCSLSLSLSFSLSSDSLCVATCMDMTWRSPPKARA